MDIALKMPMGLVMLVVLMGSAVAEAGPEAVGRPQAGVAKLFSVKVTGKGPGMILIPGLSCGGHVWDRTVAHFQDRYECHVVTLAGFAGEAAIQGPMLEKIRDGLVAYILDEGLERPVIVGHSLGAFMSYWLGATFPDQVGPIIAVDGVPYFPGLADPKATPESTRRMAEGMRSMQKVQKPEQAAFAMRMFLRPMVTDEKDFEEIAKWSVKSDPNAVGQALYELMTTDLRPLVGKIRSRVLVVGASAISAVPEQRRQLEEHYRLQVLDIPKHEVIFAPQARHFIQMDEPEFLFREMEKFLVVE
jgi:N-formylmaleamate deformylase